MKNNIETIDLDNDKDSDYNWYTLWCA
jgi:hypothetical protein